MTISASVSTQIPTNVVEIGNEISASQLAAITSASAPTGGNPFLTTSAGNSSYLGINALSGYATESWVSSQGYATQSWVSSQGYITSSSGIGQDQAYAISLVSLVNSTMYMSNWSGTIAFETPYLSANKVAMFKFLINNSVEFTPTWSGTSWFMNSVSDDTSYTQNGTESFTIKWNGSNSGIPVI